MSGEDVALMARTWLGTPYHHQASAKGIGTDCLGLIRGLWREQQGQEPYEIPAYSRDWAEPQGEELLWNAAHSLLIPCGELALGAVILFRMRDDMVAKHLGVVSKIGETPMFIHAYMRHGVVESPFSIPWQRRVVSYFQFP